MQELLTKRQQLLHKRNEAIRASYELGVNMAQLARKYHISRQRVHQIVRYPQVRLTKKLT